MGTSNTPRFVRALRRAYDEKKGRSELEGAEAGFTLIELMVVLLIMAILLAIAIPTFLGVKGSAQDRAAQSNITNALTSAKAGFANNGLYSSVAATEATALGSAEPNLTFTAGGVSQGSGNSISVNVSSGGLQLILVAFSPSSTASTNGTCWAASDDEGEASANLLGGVTKQGIVYADWAASSTGVCSAATASLPSSITWNAQYA
ncbi:MAG: type IV pilin protein [Acidimicrobiales bacterium]